jgi:prolipoprotein diacylglyceryltransferase
VPLAVVALDFDPVLRLGGLAVRLDTLVAAAGILVALLVAAAVARTTPPAPRPSESASSLRLDDLLFVVLAAIPGALVGGRLGYALLHLDYYAANPVAIVDPGQGSLELTLAVVGGGLSGLYGARMLSESAGRWFHVAALPTLLALGIGKLSMALGGAGQGAPSTADWATRYLGPGPWGSLAPDVASHPAQLYEAVGIVVVALLLVALGAAGSFDRRDGTAWLVALGGWAIVRTAVASTWRDALVVGPLRAEQLISPAVLVGCAVMAIWLWRRPAPSGRGARPRRCWRVATSSPRSWSASPAPPALTPGCG